MFATSLQALPSAPSHDHPFQSGCPECCFDDWAGAFTQSPPADGDLCCLCVSLLIGIGVFGGANLLAASRSGLATLLTTGGRRALPSRLQFEVSAPCATVPGNAAGRRPWPDSPRLMGVQSVLAT